MDTERWKKVKVILAEALERGPGERASYLAHACGGDASLQRDVETLLESAESGDSMLASPLPRMTGPERDHHFAPGCLVGAYRIVRELGRGGMGSVYLAARADDVYSKNVAIKVVQHGMESESVLARFRAERQILAALDHPNIARVVDGGSTAGGRPYFVMEYVDGKPIDVYCDERGLDVSARIRLFLGVCAAVEHAHRHLVVHRDLKPSNILVTAEGVPKLLDFGIAKLLAEGPDTTRLDLTSPSARVMTPEYASPEQVRGEFITTATDIYSLGVVLYKLLTGRRPYGEHLLSAADLEGRICVQPPRKPSSVVMRPADETDTQILTPEEISRRREGRPEKLRKRLEGDIDTILLMTLRKEPSRRYSSVEQFADDLRRHLEHQPVRARPDTWAYRAAKFARRNPAAFVTAVLLVLSLAAGTVTTSWQARIARAQRMRAERRFEDVRKLANSFLFEFHDAIQALPGATPARELVVRRALEYLDSLSKEATGEAGLQRELASAYQRVGDVQGNASIGNLGDTEGALRSQTRALVIREALASKFPDDPQTGRELSTSFDRVGDLLWFRGERQAALARYRTSLAIRRKLWEKNPDRENAHLLCASCNNVGDLLVELQDFGGASASYQEGLAVAGRAHAAYPGDVRAERDLSVSHNRMGDSYWYAGKVTDALAEYQHALAIRRRLASENPSNAVFQRDVMASHNNIGEALARLGSRTEALANFRAGLEIARALRAADPRNAQAQRDLAVAHRNVGTALLESGQRSAALAELRQALAGFESLAARDPHSAVPRKDVADTRELVRRIR